MARKRGSGWIVGCSCLAALLVAACSEDRKASAVAIPDAGADLPDHTAGKACKRDADCATGRCARMLQVQQTEAQEGYCTTDCDSDSRCGLGGACSVLAGEQSGECMATCAGNEDCRKGYICAGGGRAGALMVMGMCQPKAETGQLEDGTVGQACVSDANCRGGTCASASPLGTKLPGNYCTARCFEDSECGSGGACLLLEGSSEAGNCYDACSSDEDCTREGYRCRNLGPDLDACYPAPTSLPDNTAGRACSRDADCGGARDSCADDLPFGSWFGYEIVAAPGGYCTQTCSRDSECGQGAQCISRGVEGGMCLARCIEPGDCRESYQCVTHGRDNDIDQVCVPVPPTDAGAP
jgi:hypothetical protein